MLLLMLLSLLVLLLMLSLLMSLPVLSRCRTNLDHIDCVDKMRKQVGWHEQRHQQDWAVVVTEIAAYSVMYHK